MSEALPGASGDSAEMIELRTSLDDFLHAAVHDIRGPLGQIRALAVLLERHHKAGLNADGQELCGLIDAASQRAVDVVESIYTYALAVEAPTPEAADLNAIFDAARFAVQAVIEQNTASVTRGDLGFVCGDRAKLLILLQEVLRNALRFRSEAPPRIHCSAEATGNSLTVSVVDNGLGIASKESESVFKPLKRLHGRDFEGSGMGLAICRRIVEVQGGEIWVESHPEGGSNVRFTLPLLRD